MFHVAPPAGLQDMREKEENDMLCGLKELLTAALADGYAVPAFNVYNLETALGVASAAAELKSPVIVQVYSRLFETGRADYLAPSILKIIGELPVPAAFHLDHGSGLSAVVKALRSGASGIMIDASLEPLEENIRITSEAVRLCGYAGQTVEGELGHIGSTKDERDGIEEGKREAETDVAETGGFVREAGTDMAEAGGFVRKAETDVAEAVQFVRETGVAALAPAVGTAHGRYHRQPKVDIGRIREIREAAGIPLVLHGGSGVPDDQVREAVKAGIAKVNFGTDLCYSFLDRVFETSRETYAVDLFMDGPIAAVKEFAAEKIKLLGADGHA